jgi:hypothetical protein
MFSAHTQLRPAPDEHSPWFAGYIAAVPEGDILQRLAGQAEELNDVFTSIPAARLDFRYAPGKWSPLEIVGHLCDTERIMAYRALRIARADLTPLAGFDENAYVEAAGFGDRGLTSLLEELRSIRVASLSLLRSFPEEAWSRRGVSNDAAVTVRALAWIIAGHANHHVSILHQRYGLSIER